ncbi:MAG TPA: hypothetical protein VET65_10125 [Candidatus Limnocylindrales bacterium]|nr:hypothetical protein [Candidatus Limnocylindrales bacterium]
MPAAYDWLVVGDIALERSGDRGSAVLLGGAGARLAAHGAANAARVALVAKTGDDAAGRSAREVLARFRVDLRFAPVAPGQRTTTWTETAGRPQARRLDRGADLLLRLDEIPGPASIRAGLTVVSGFSLSVEPARSAALGALAGARARGGMAALQLEADLLWWTNARVARVVLEPAVANADLVALTAADLAVLFGSRTSSGDGLRAIGRMGPATAYLADRDGGLLLLDQGHTHVIASSPKRPATDRFAGPAAFFRAVAAGVSPRRAAAESLVYAQTARRPAVRRSPGARTA